MSGGRPQFSGTTIVTRVDETSLIGVNSLGKKITVGTTAVELKSGTDAVTGRTAIFCQAFKDNTGYIDLSFNADGNNPFAYLAAGVGIEFQLMSDQIIKVYAKGSAAGQVVYICEVKK